MEIKIGTKKSQVMTNDYANGPKCWGNTAGPTQCIARAPAQAPWVLWIDAIIA